MCDVGSFNRKFSHICTHDFTFDTEEVTKVCFFEDLVVFVTDRIFTYVDLDLTITVLNVGKANFTFTTFCHQTTCDSSSIVDFVQFFFCFISVFFF